MPFRDSKLTKMLQPYLQSGGSNISVILTLGESTSDSLNTLTFGMRLKDIKPRQNEYPNETNKKFTALEKEIQSLKQEIKFLKHTNETERGMWEDTLQDMHHEKQGLIGVVNSARRKVCGVLEIDERCPSSLDDLVEGLISKVAWDLNESCLF